jgi:hypothetical protein
MIRVFVASLFSICLLSCGGLKLDSHWLDRNITIDGDDSDWQDLKWYVKDWPVDIGIANDADFLYVNLSTADRSLQRQAIMRGFELWVDPGGGKGRVLGVRYPLGMAGRDRESFEESRLGQGAGADRFGRRNQNDEISRLKGPEQLQKAFERMLTSQRPMLLGKGEQEIRALNMSNDEDVRVAVTYSEGRLVYEARFPLRGSYPLPPLPAKEGKSIGVGFRTRDSGAAAPSFGGFRGARGGRDGRYGGDGYGRGNGFGSRRPRGFPRSDLEPIEKWTKVALARPSTD